jgi:hypothetical protein
MYTYIAITTSVAALLALLPKTVQVEQLEEILT